MSDDQRFNIRVYGLWLNEGRVLVSEEEIKGTNIIKFPGGGLEFGEGTIDCLKREWKEELDMDIEVLNHFYTTDYYQPSAFDKSQVVSIYYLVKPLTDNNYIVNKNDNEVSYWMKLTDITKDTFPLPIDKRVAEMLLSRFE